MIGAVDGGSSRRDAAGLHLQAQKRQKTYHADTKNLSIPLPGAGHLPFRPSATRAPASRPRPGPSPSRQMLFPAHLRNEGAELMIRLDAVLGVIHEALRETLWH
jgi:hypothetical protein